MNGRPDRRSLAGGREPAGDVIALAELGHLLDRHLDLQRQELALLRVDDGDRAKPRTVMLGKLIVESSFGAVVSSNGRAVLLCDTPPEKPGACFEWPLRRR